jgi:hypothetical protein
VPPARVRHEPQWPEPRKHSGRHQCSDHGPILPTNIAKPQPQRRFRNLCTVTRVLAVGVPVVIFLLLAPAGMSATSPLRVAQTPYIGVSCPAPNVTTCRRVGIAVWLARHGASAVVVSLAGVRAQLVPPPRDTRSPSWRTFVHLPLAAMGIPVRWYGEPSKVLTLRISARYGGRWLARTLAVPLSTGWG